MTIVKSEWLYYLLDVSELMTDYVVFNCFLVTTPLPNSVEEWLKNIKLEQYCSVFIKHNYDLLETLRYLDEMAVDKMGIIGGHKKYLVKQAKDLSIRMISN
jgi:SAM domain (Sterile alpha motif)